MENGYGNGVSINELDKADDKESKKDERHEELLHGKYAETIDNQTDDKWLVLSGAL